MLSEKKIKDKLHIFQFSKKIQKPLSKCQGSNKFLFCVFLLRDSNLRTARLHNLIIR